jgi:Tfp pilus assembly protein PilF
MMGWAMVSLMTSCATTRMAQVDPVTQDVILLSSGDDRSALPDARVEPGVGAAADDYSASIKRDPKDVTALVGMARIHVMRNEYAEAEARARQALRVDMKHIGARKVLAEVAIRRGQGDLALIVLSGLGGVDAKDSEVLNMMALVALQQLRNDEAMAIFKRALQVNPNDLAVRMNLGVLHLRYSQVPQAATQFERVLAVMPEHRDARLHMAMIQAIRGQSSDARAVYQATLKTDKDNPLALYNLAVTDFRQGDMSGATERLRTYLRSGRPNAGETARVTALLDDIARERGAKGEDVSDDEIRALAARSPEPLMQGEIRRGLEAGKPLPGAPKTASPRVAKVAPAEVQPRGAIEDEVDDGQELPAMKPASVAQKAVPEAPVKPVEAKPAAPVKSPVEEDIEDLEKALSH